jgi:hypothetical protein
METNLEIQSLRSSTEEEEEEEDEEELFQNG